MPDSLMMQSCETGAPTRDSVSRVSINRFIFVMKAIAENDLWDEVADHLAAHGHAEVLVSSESIVLVQDFLKERVLAGEAVGKRGRRFMASLSCFGGHPTPPAKFPPGPGGGGGGPDGGPPPGPPPDGGDGGPPSPPPTPQ